MTKGKKLYVSIILFIIIVFYIWFIILDFARFFTQNYNYDIYPSALLKRINVILAAFIAWAAGRDGLSLKDNRRMNAAFAFIILGEAAFIIGERVFGVGMFAVCQTLLILRNSTGMCYGFNHVSHNQKKRLIISGLIIMLIIIVLTSMFDALTKISSELIVVYLYGIILSLSLWAGLASNILALLPKRNSKMVAGGMICFYCCDVLVGLDVVMEIGIPWLFVNSFIWIFYIPALILLALSCYKYN